MKQTTNYFAVLSLDDVDEGEAADEAEVEDITPSTHDAPQTSFSSLTEKVPAELRLKIFGLVLQAQHSVVNVSHLPPYKRGDKFNTALFTVSRTISAEALEIFYEVNILRAKSLNDPYQSRALTRHLEIVGDIAQRLVLWPGSGFSNITIDASADWPRLRSISLAVDCVADGGLKVRLYPSQQSATPEEKSDESPPKESPFRIVDYGVHELKRESTPTYKYYLKHFGLIDAVAYVRRLGPDVSLQGLRCLYEVTIDTKHSEPRRYVRYLFAFELACFEAWRTTRAGATLDESEQEVLDEFLLNPPYMPSDIDDKLERLPAETRLLDMSVEHHGIEVFGLANEIVLGHLPLPPRRYGERR